MILCDPMNYSPPGSSVHGILLARILEWVTISSPRESSDLQIKLSSLIFPALAGGFFTTTTTWEAQMCVCVYVCVCMCVCIYMCVCVYIYACTFIYTHIYYLYFFSFYSISRVFSICTILFSNSPTFFSIHICLYKYSPPINKHWAVTYSE